MAAVPSLASYILIGLEKVAGWSVAKLSYKEAKGMASNIRDSQG